MKAAKTWNFIADYIIKRLSNEAMNNIIEKYFNKKDIELSTNLINQ